MKGRMVTQFGGAGFQPVKEFKDACGTSFYSLAEILHSIKSYSSNQINRMLRKSGSLWLDENFDRL